MGTARDNLNLPTPTTAGDNASQRVGLLFYVGVPVLTAVLFGLNQIGMARVLPREWAIPYWLGLSLPLWLLLDACSRGIHHLVKSLNPHRWLVLLAGSLIAMAVFSPYVMVYTHIFSGRTLNGLTYSVSTPFPEGFLDLRRFLSFSGVPVYWICISMFFARHFGVPSYLVADPPTAQPIALPVPLPQPAAVAEAQAALPAGEGEPSGFRALLPPYLGDDLISLQAEDHYVRVVAGRGNALIRYRFSDAIAEVRGTSGLQVHRSYWIALSAIKGVRSSGSGLTVDLVNGAEVPVSRTNIGVLKSAGLI